MAIPRSRAVFYRSARALSAKARTQERGTHVLLLHEGFPRSEFYARKALSLQAQSFYNIPRRLHFEVPKWLIPAKVGRCMEDYGKHGEVQDTVMIPLARSLEDTLEQLLPELNNVHVSCVSPFESPTISESVINILGSGPTKLIVMPLQPHFACMRSGLLLNEVARCISAETQQSHEHPRARIVPLTATSVEVSCIERWSTHPVISNLWSSRLELLRSSLEGVIFAAPVLRGLGRRDYERSVYASAERIIAETRVPLPWRVAFFNSWDQWDLPLCESISSQCRNFGNKRVAVVPITSVIPSFDTISTLPHLLSSRPSLQLLPPTLGPILVQGMAEAIKNHVLGRRCGQLSLSCRGCFRNDCQLTRELLA